MTKFKLILLAAAILVLGSSANAQSNVNEERCKALQSDMQAAYERAVTARVPTQAPGKAVDEAVDLRSFMAVDTSAGFSKLVSTGFNKLIDRLIQKGMDAATKKANSTFTKNVNDILKRNGVPAALRDSDVAPLTSQVGQTAAKVVTRPAATTPTTTNPYDRP